MARFLATTALEEFWDVSRPLLFLTKSCLIYSRRGRLKGFNYEVLGNPWNDRVRFFETAEQLDQTAESLLSTVASALNRVHGIRRDDRYWRILLGPWLVHFVHVVFDRYTMIKDALSKYPDLDSLCLAPTSFVCPQDYKDYQLHVSRDVYNLQIASQILAFLGCRFRTQDYAFGIPAPGRPWKLLVRYLLGRAATHSSRIMTAAWAKHWHVGLWGMHSDLCIHARFAIGSGLRVLPIPQAPLPQGQPRPDHALRRSLGDLTGTDEFTRLWLTMLPSHLPTVYLEGFSEAVRESRRVYRRVPPVVVSATGWYRDSLLKFVIADRAGRGTRLVALQHGGGYGQYRYTAPERHERRLSDVFAVWGWAGSKAGTRNLPDPELSEILRPNPRAHAAPAETILFVSSAHSRFLSRFNVAPVGDQAETYFGRQIEVLKALPDHVVSRIVYCPFASDYDQCVRDRITEAVPNLMWDDGKRSADRLRKHALLVIDHCGTMVLEALVSNVPTVLVWSREAWEERPEAQPFFDRLRASGVLLHDPTEAASRIQQDPSWWWSCEVQRARERFVDRYAKADREWPRQWVRFLRREVQRGLQRPFLPTGRRRV